MLTVLRFLAVLFACVAPLFADAPKDRPMVEVRRAEEKAADGLTEAKVGQSDRKVYLHKKVELGNEDIKEAKSASGADGIPRLELTLTDAGAKKLAKVSEEHKNKPLAILIDGNVVLAPTVKEKLGDTITVTGAFTEGEASRLAKAINGN